MDAMVSEELTTETQEGLRNGWESDPSGNGFAWHRAG